MLHKQAEAVPWQMERERKKKKKKEKQSSSERSPLQELKRIPRCNTSVPSSSTCVSVEAPSGCLRFWLSANSNSSSSSSSRPQYQRKPRCLSKLGNKPISTTPKSAPNSTRLRSKVFKENESPRVTSQKSKKNPSFLSHWQSGRKPSSKTTQAPKLSSNLSNSLKNAAFGSERFGANRKDLKLMEQENNGSGSGQPTELFSFKVADNLNDVESYTPVGKLPCWSALDSSIFDDKPVGVDSNSANTQTPPIEASVSPEIQSGVTNLLVSATTPVCYGAGHLLSGVTDKRKCRSRGILTIGGDIDESACGRTNVCVDDGNEFASEVLPKSRPSFIPLHAEASMRWLSSPHGENDKVQKCDSADQCMTVLSSSSIGLSFSPPNCSFPSDLVSHSDDINQSSNIDSTASTGKTRIVLLSPRRNLGPSPKKMDADLLSNTPPSRSSCDIDCPLKEGNLSYRSLTDFSTGEKPPFSTSFVGTGNVIQTPKSDSSSDRLVNISQIDADDSQRKEYDLDIDSVAETFDRTSLSPGSHTLMWDPPGFTDFSPSCHSINDLENCASWVSDSTLQNMSLSQMRISWREGLVSRIFDTDEFDCCRCLSDEEKDVGQSDKLHLRSPIGQSDKLHMKSPTAFESITVEQQNPFENDVLKSPEFLEQEPKILGKGKENSSLAGPNVCAESISTDGGGLVSSGDSDWTLCYKNRLFEV